MVGYTNGWGAFGEGWKSVWRAIASISQFLYVIFLLVVESLARRQHLTVPHTPSGLPERWMWSVSLSLPVWNNSIRDPGYRGAIAAVKRNTTQASIRKGNFSGQFRGQKHLPEGTGNQCKAEDVSSIPEKKKRSPVMSVGSQYAGPFNQQRVLLAANAE
ncbi:hypothetical protein K449DRAFT_432755 [Hypoxylon sp. EC38]|nr:hypothetical protein K449DRAFT_432755 [Hypoxylon sp. EC38]